MRIRGRLNFAPTTDFEKHSLKGGAKKRSMNNEKEFIENQDDKRGN